MRTLRVLLILSSTLIILGCKTAPDYEIELPPRPEREKIEAPQTVKECAEVIVYYEMLVRKWEAWADTVETMTQKNYLKKRATE